VLQKFPEIAEQVHAMAEERRQKTIAEKRNQPPVDAENARIENIHVSYEQGRVLLNWQDVAGVTGYQVARVG
jgi:hypothetical protein